MSAYRSLQSIASATTIRQSQAMGQVKSTQTAVRWVQAASPPLRTGSGCRKGRRPVRPRSGTAPKRMASPQSEPMQPDRQDEDPQRDPVNADQEPGHLGPGAGSWRAGLWPSGGRSAGRTCGLPRSLLSRAGGPHRHLGAVGRCRNRSKGPLMASPSQM